MFLANLVGVAILVSRNYHSAAEILSLTLIGALISTVCMSLLAAPLVLAFVAVKAAYRKRRAQNNTKHDGQGSVGDSAVVKD